VITLDVKERISAFIWSKEALPFDCVRALPVPKPIGGTLIFAVNSLFYINQVLIFYSPPPNLKLIFSILSLNHPHSSLDK
jgi:hypothetical protein